MQLLKGLFILLFFLNIHTLLCAQSGFPKIRLAVSGGYGVRFGEKPSNDAYFNEISNGTVFNGSASYFMTPKSGLGLTYGLFSTAASGVGSYGYLISNIKIGFLGPQYTLRLTPNDYKTTFVFSGALGWMHYTDNGWINSNKGVIKGNSFGGMIDVGVDFKLIKNLSVGINGPLYIGAVKSFKRVTDSLTYAIKPIKKESLVRGDITAGLRYSF